MKSECEMSNMNGMMNMPDEESEVFDLFDGSADIVNADTAPEEVLITMDDSDAVPEEYKQETSIPPVSIRATGYHVPHFWMPWLQYPVTAQGVFDLALTVNFVDPARLQLGSFYEAQLKRECKMLVPHPIPCFYPQGILKALMLRRSNPGFFMCYAIDIVLTHYLKEQNGENYNELF